MNSNNLKVIAIVCMIIDHIGYYFSYAMSDNIYLICRVIGRIAMPIFVYLLVQGYFNTKSIKKYKMRLFVCAIITQIAILTLKYININYFKFYTVEFYDIINIVFSLFLSIELICLIDRKIFYANGFFVGVCDKLVRLVGIFIIGFIYMRFEIDYLFVVPVIAICLYVVEKIRLYFEYDICKFEYKIAIGTVLLILLSLSAFVVGELNLLSIFAIFFIILYNGKLGKRSKALRNLFYVIFPVQHFVLCFLAMILYENV